MFPRDVSGGELIPSVEGNRYQQVMERKFISLFYTSN